MAIDDKIQTGRAKNAVLTMLEQKLVVPKIFLDAQWDTSFVDVLAIDRAGVGDVHIVFLTVLYGLPMGVYTPESIKQIQEHIEHLKSTRAQFRYLGLVEPPSGRSAKLLPLPQEILENSFASDGLGRIGIIHIQAGVESEPVATMELKPERFRASVMQMADDYVQQHIPDWEIRA